MISFSFILIRYFFINFQRNLYVRFKSKYFTDENSKSDGESSLSSAALSVHSSDTIEIGDGKVCSLNHFYANQLDASVEKNIESTRTDDTIFSPGLQCTKSVEINCTSIAKQQQQQTVNAAKMGDTVENSDGDAARRISTSEETEKDDKFPQQMANNKNSNWNTMELGEKRKRLR